MHLFTLVIGHGAKPRNGFRRALTGHQQVGGVILLPDLGYRQQLRGQAIVFFQGFALIQPARQALMRVDKVVKGLFHRVKGLHAARQPAVEQQIL